MPLPLFSGIFIRFSILPFNISADNRDEWHALGDMPREEAARMYVDIVSTVAPDWLSWSGNKWLCALVVRFGSLLLPNVISLSGSRGKANG